MQFSERWLRSQIDPKISTAELADRLTMCGLEVEACVPVAPPLDAVVVAQVLAVERHPGADRLNVCQVDAGEAAPRTIVCGAPNVRAGIRVRTGSPGGSCSEVWRASSISLTRGCPLGALGLRTGLPCSCTCSRSR